MRRSSLSAIPQNSISPTGFLPQLKILCLISSIICLAFLAAACATPSLHNRTEPNTVRVHSVEHQVTPEVLEARQNLFAPLPPPADPTVRTVRGTPGPAYWQNQADYSVKARLDETTRYIHATCTITYTNNSPVMLDHLFLQVEQNLYRLDSAGAAMTRPGERYGNLSFSGGFELKSSTFADGSPAPLNINDTIARLNLPQPLSTGQSISFTVSYSFKIPPYASDRAGILETSDGDIYEIGQWLPQVCKFDDINGWNTLPYLGEGEFYSDFGNYTVAITVPGDYLVAATGQLTNESDVLAEQEQLRLSQARSSPTPIVIRSINDITKRPRAADGSTLVPPDQTWIFSASGVRTFAFAASRAFAWDACSIPRSELGDTTALQAALATLNTTPSPTVLCQSFYPRPAAARWAPRDEKDDEDHSVGSTNMLVQALKHYSNKWFPYPYPAMTQVAGKSAGMEYPMLAFSAEDESDEDLFNVTTHELSHNYFPMMVNTDERRHGWMDEGFTTFINHFSKLQRHSSLPNPVADFATHYTEPIPEPIITPPDHLLSGLMGVLQYEKPAVGLHILRDAIIGPDRFDNAFRTYIRLWAFKSPQPEDFFRLMQDQTGKDLSWFFREWFGQIGVLDQSIKTVMQPSRVGDDSESQNVRVTIENLGSLIAPVFLSIEYDDGTIESRTLPVEIWAVGNQWQSTWDSRGRNIRSLAIDPDNLLPDINRSNSRWSR